MGIFLPRRWLFFEKRLESGDLEGQVTTCKSLVTDITSRFASTSMAVANRTARAMGISIVTGILPTWTAPWHAKCKSTRFSALGSNSLVFSLRILFRSSNAYVFWFLHPQWLISPTDPSSTPPRIFPTVHRAPNSHADTAIVASKKEPTVADPKRLNIPCSVPFCAMAYPSAKLTRVKLSTYHSKKVPLPELVIHFSISIQFQN
ncbi:hypothetical protein M9H77_34918 [Catharanthus roseus]|uniref:Uncharacterized protein n=1 Tax=Catharanthus roseus TaxID=4058 RepID=A0ACB9ZN95_CATRO|nr:hypothetical protein M9H77_34918 [Catharanthus roseus]